MKLNIQWQQPSTLRGLVMALTGLLTLALNLTGHDAAASQIETVSSYLLNLIAGGITTSGLIGIFGDDQRP